MVTDYTEEEKPGAGLSASGVNEPPISGVVGLWRGVEG